MRALIVALLVSVFLISCSGKVSTYEKNIQDAKRYFNELRYKSAIIEAKNAIQKKPANYEPRLLLAEIYLSVQNGQAAEKELKKAEENGADKKLVNLMFMKAYLIMNKFSDVLKIKKASIHDNSIDLSNYHVYRALASASLNDFDNADNELKKAKNINGEFTEYNIAKAKISLANSDIANAEDVVTKLLASNSKNPEILLLRAKIDINKKNYDAAISLLNDITNNQRSEGYIGPIIYSSYILLTNIYIKQEKYEQADNVIKVIRSTSQKSYLPDYLQGLVYYRKNEYQNSKEYLQASETKNPQHLETLMLIGAVDYALGFYNQAESYLKKYLSINPKNNTVRKLLGLTELKLKKPDKALENFSLVLKKTPNDEKLLSIMGDTAIQLGKTNVGRGYLNKAIKGGADKDEINLSLAKSYLAEGNEDEAIKLLRENSNNDKTVLGKKLLLFGVYVKSQRYVEAKEVVLEIVKENPDVSASYYLLGYYYSLVNEMQQAETQYKKALNINPDFIPALINLGKLYILSEHYDLAKKYIENVIDINNKNVQAMLMLALINEKTGDKKSSITWLKRSVKTKSDTVLPRVALIRYYLSIADYQNALNLAIETAKLFPGNIVINELLADTQIANRKIQDARNTVEQSIQINPDSPRNYVRLGQIEANMGNYDDAKNYFKHALSLRNGYLPAVESLARVELLLNNEKDAFAWVKKLKNDEPDSTTGFELAGNLYVIKKDYKRAEKEYKNALSLAKTPEIFGKYLYVLSKNNDNSAVISVAEDWLKTYPEDHATRMKLALMLHSYDACKDAIPHYEYLNKSNGQNVVILNNLALCYMKLDDNKALEYGSEVYDIAPENDAVNDTFGWVLVNFNKELEGLKYLNLATQFNPTNPEYKYHKAVALYRLNRREEAKLILQDILDENADFNDIESAKKLYEKM